MVQPQAREGLAACAAVVGVDDAELRQIFDLPSGLAQAVAQVGVFGAVEDGFVELAHLVERLTAYHLAGTYHIVGLDGALVVSTKLLGGRAQS